MKKLLKLTAILAMVLMAVTPAVAQVLQEHDTEAQSAPIETNFEVANEGDFAGQCTPGTQFGNTVSPVNRLDFLQVDSELDNLEFGGSLNVVQYNSELGDVGGEDAAMTFEPTQDASCERAVEQSTAAG